MTPAAITLYPNNIKRLRRTTGLSPRDVAEKAGVSIAVYYRLQRGQQPLTQPLAEALARAFGCSTTDLGTVHAANADVPQPPRRGRKPAKAVDLEKLIAAVMAVPKHKRRLALKLLALLCEREGD